MADSLSSSVRVSVGHTFVRDGDLADPSEQVSLSYSKVLANGTGATQANRVWADDRAIAATTRDNLDLAGTLTNIFGQTITFVKVRAIYIELTTATSGAKIEVGGGSDGSGTAAAPIFKDVSDIVEVPASGCLLLTSPVDGFAITATTADLLSVYNPGAEAIAYKVWIIGTSA